MPVFSKGLCRHTNLTPSPRNDDRGRVCLCAREPHVLTPTLRKDVGPGVPERTDGAGVSSRSGHQRWWEGGSPDGPGSPGSGPVVSGLYLGPPLTDRPGWRPNVCALVRGQRPRRRGASGTCGTLWWRSVVTGTGLRPPCVCSPVTTLVSRVVPQTPCPGPSPQGRTEWTAPGRGSSGTTLEPRATLGPGVSRREGVLGPGTGRVWINPTLPEGSLLSTRESVVQYVHECSTTSVPVFPTALSLLCHSSWGPEGSRGWARDVKGRTVTGLSRECPLGRWSSYDRCDDRSGLTRCLRLQ